MLAYLNSSTPQKHLNIDGIFKWEGFWGHFLMKEEKKEEEKNTEKQTLKIGKHVLQHFRLRGDGGSFWKVFAFMLIFFFF